jgi:hypothetical protein
MAQKLCNLPELIRGVINRWRGIEPQPSYHSSSQDSNENSPNRNRYEPLQDPHDKDEPPTLEAVISDTLPEGELPNTAAVELTSSQDSTDTIAYNGNMTKVRVEEVAEEGEIEERKSEVEENIKLGENVDEGDPDQDFHGASSV